jgi:hypothetical protein
MITLDEANTQIISLNTENMKARGRPKVIDSDQEKRLM